MPPRVLCNAAWELQRCMAPLMWLDGDEILEASLLGPTDDGSGVPPTLEEEAVLLGDELKPQEATTSPLNAQKPPKLKNLPKQSDAPSPPAPLSMTSNSHSDLPWNTRRAKCRARPQHPLTSQSRQPQCLGPCIHRGEGRATELGAGLQVPLP